MISLEDVQGLHLSFPSSGLKKRPLGLRLTGWEAVEDEGTEAAHRPCTFSERRAFGLTQKAGPMSQVRGPDDSRRHRPSSSQPRSEG